MKRVFLGEDTEHMSKALWMYLSRKVREDYGNPILIWFLLNVIVPAVIRLVIKWWLNRGALS